MHTDPVHIWTPDAVEATQAGESVWTLRLDVSFSTRALRAYAETPDATATVGEMVANAVHETAHELLTGARG